MSTFTLPQVEPINKTALSRECGTCTACCDWLPLLAEPGFWEEYKPAYQPCRYCQGGCSLHDQARPEICTSFRCLYLQGVVPWRPSEVNVIFSVVSPDIAQVVLGFPDPDCGGLAVEGQTNAILNLEATKMRYLLRKRKRQWQYLLVFPYGFDPNDDKEWHIRKWDNLYVAWNDDAMLEYAFKVLHWWEKN